MCRGLPCQCLEASMPQGAGHEVQSWSWSWTAALVQHHPGWLRLILQQRQSKGVQPQGAGHSSCTGGDLLVLTSSALCKKSQGVSGKREGGLFVPGGGTSEQGLVFVQLYLCGFCLCRGRWCKTCVCKCMCSLSCFSPPGNQNRNPDGWLTSQVTKVCLSFSLACSSGSVFQFIQLMNLWPFATVLMPLIVTGRTISCCCCRRDAEKLAKSSLWLLTAISVPLIKAKTAS